MTTGATHQHIEQVFPSAYGGDGYDAIAAMQAARWIVISAWGEDGWDAGNWPYVVLAIRKVSDHATGAPDRTVWETLEYCEGDITITPWTLRGDAVRHLDKIVHWHWQHSSTGPDSPDLDNPAHCGPFSWHRLCIKNSEPSCSECQAAGEVLL